ncbi:hypothetical protein [Pseudoduganella aquatica]|uniref:Uncharacterized protein n=1 Tax=Pseudoduganella aquatica TaxID=2660641 RepID=A0A7X4HG00_9BURK|nr:hypothetical protein [Pseudoduganella aquatica]MYN09832.1 hypothetical protein [Pseudoduganella aquatica]
MDDGKFQEAVNAAINAAQRVMFDAGVTDLVVHQLGFSKVADIKAGKKDLKVDVVFGCPCWDCTQGGGPCICNGPACH